MPDPEKKPGDNGENQIKIIPDAASEGDKPVEVDLGSGKDQPAVTAQDIEKLHKRLEYQGRQLEKALKELRQPAIQTPPPQGERTGTRTDDDVDEIDKVAEKDWKKAVRLLAAEEAEAKYQARKKAEEEESARKRLEQTLEKSKNLVLENYPEIEDENSDVARSYQEVLNEDPSLLSDPKGPEIAMYRMERRLGVKPSTHPSDVDREVQRRMRISSTPQPQGQALQSSIRHIMTQSEKQFCDSRGITYAEFIKNRELTPQSFKEGVSVE